MKKIADKKILITGIESDASNRLHLHYLIKHIQMLDMIHSEQIGLSSEALEERGLAWIIITNQIKLLQNRPRPKDNLIIETWISKIKGIKFYRENKYYINEPKAENLVGLGASTWILTTKEDHKPVKPKKYFDSDWLQSLVEPQQALTEKIDNLKSFTSQNLGIKLMNYTISYGDLDINGHLNNTHYVKLAIDAYARYVDFDNHKDIIEIENFTIKYEKEMFYGQTLIIYLYEKVNDIYIEGKDEDEKVSFIVKADFKLNKKLN